MPEQPDKDKLRRRTQDYMRYSGMGVQMGIIILLGVFGGKRLDAYFDTEPLLTVVLSLLAIAAAMYLTLKDLV